ncbi:MAG: hypothetical protein A2Z47_13200 [Thermodesulfovibrio sp. RBG_19FT_COMBO_42_12]|nr:MAG: hypothetical protein A2Z47_13200 [Thermodesulfovibrio sp. RBG_19FT_COMBO_42_12]
MLWLSENDLKNFFGEVIRNVAKELKVKEWEWLFHTELLEQIKNKNAAVSEKLEAFFTAYKNWHDFHVKVDSENKAGSLSTEENNERQNHISAREAARETLLKELRKQYGHT